jgi:alkylation response protein AidB-like acyl-CoA dehydrogenase
VDLTFSEQYEEFRAEVRVFLNDNWPLRGEQAELAPEERAAIFRKRAIERGYLSRGIPRKYGGSEQPPDLFRGAIIGQEFGRAGAPGDPPPPVAQLTPTLLQHGSELQKERFLPKTITGELRWCQGYSEPGAGSDLASLQTRAELVGDEWVISGQKIWTTGAQFAQMMYLLCRTEPDASKPAGISYLLLDMKQPGIEVRPLKMLNGAMHFSQVFFDDVRTPAEYLVGKRGEGWLVSRSTLEHESGRAAMGAVASGRNQFDRLVTLAKTSLRNGRPAIESPDIRQRLIEIEGYVTAHEYSTYRQLTCAARGESPGASATMNKLVTTDIGHLVAQLAIDLIDEDALRAPAPAGGLPGESWMGQYMSSLSIAVAAGTSNIQRNIIGERALGLPRDFAAQRSR